jgi:hypothetical protein
MIKGFIWIWINFLWYYQFHYYSIIIISRYNDYRISPQIPIFSDDQSFPSLIKFRSSILLFLISISISIQLYLIIIINNIFPIENQLKRYYIHEFILLILIYKTIYKFFIYHIIIIISNIPNISSIIIIIHINYPPASKFRWIFIIPISPSFMNNLYINLYIYLRST